MARRIVHRPQTREQIREALVQIYPNLAESPERLEPLVEADLALQGSARMRLGSLVVPDDTPLAEGVETVPAEDWPALENEE